jgi:glycosyltransferase involved in cell wall biosynthesis
MNGVHMHGVCPPQELYINGRRSIKEAMYFAWKLMPSLMREEFDVVDCQGFPFFSCFIAKLHSLLGKSRLIITLHEVWGDYWYSYLGSMGFFGKIIEKSTLHLTDRMISVSKKTQKDLEKLVKNKESVVIPNGINLQEIEKVVPATESPDVLFAGRLIKEKNVDLLVQAIGLIKKTRPDIKCLIIGEGPERENIKSLVKDYQLVENISFYGFMEERSQLISYYKSSKVFVLPSQREGFGMVVIEANSCGMPVVTVKASLNAAVDLIRPGFNGYVAERNVEDLASKIIKSLDEKKQMAEDCIKFAKDYDWNRIIPILEKYYLETTT